MSLFHFASPESRLGSHRNQSFGLNQNILINNNAAGNVCGNGKNEGVRIASSCVPGVRNVSGGLPSAGEMIAGLVRGATQSPQSSQTSGRIFHNIPHDFKVKKFPSFSSLSSLCIVCKRSITLWKIAKCQSCKMIVHCECKSFLSDDTCGLTKEHVKSIISLLTDPTPPPPPPQTDGSYRVSSPENTHGRWVGDTGWNGDRSMKQNSWSQSSEMRSTWKEVTINIDSIRFREPKVPLGHGMFGRTYKGYRHQDVAVKFLDMNHVHPDTQVEAFKNEVNCYKHTRHEKLVLLLGYSLEPGNLAIVLNYCDGKTLHQLIHLSPGRLDPNKAYEIAVQITQGMSYLHGKSIRHKDLRGKNVFVEPTGKVVITDFGLFSMRRLIGASSNSTRGSKYRVSDHWLCYLAPELIVSMQLPESRSPLTQFDYVTELPFSFASDVYAFGSVWFEMMTGEFPLANLDDGGSIIYQVGKGIQPSLPPRRPHVNAHGVQESNDEFRAYLTRVLCVDFIMYLFAPQPSHF